MDAKKTLVLAFVMDYCNTGSPQHVADAQQRVLNALQPVSSPALALQRRRLSQLLHDELHWLDVPERVQYKLEVMVNQCLQYRAPRYVVDCCIQFSDIRQHLLRQSTVLDGIAVPTKYVQARPLRRLCWSMETRFLGWRSDGLELATGRSRPPIVQ